MAETEQSSEPIKADNPLEQWFVDSYLSFKKKAKEEESVLSASEEEQDLSPQVSRESDAVSIKKLFEGAEKPYRGMDIDGTPYRVGYIDESKIPKKAAEDIVKLWNELGDIQIVDGVTDFHEFRKSIGNNNLSSLITNQILYVQDGKIHLRNQGGICRCHSCASIFVKDASYACRYLGRKFVFCSFDCYEEFNQMVINYCRLGSE